MKATYRHSCLSLFVLYLIACGFCLIGAPQALAVDYEGYDGTGDITLEEARATADVHKSDYDALGLKMDESIVDKMQAPYPEDTATGIMTQRHIYVGANGSNANVYTVRKGLSVLGPTNTDKKSIKKTTDIRDDNGQLYGAYGFYRTSNNFPKASKGGSVESYLSGNVSSGSKADVLHWSKSDFSGKYATSVAYSATGGNDAKQDHVAELHASTTNATTRIDDVVYTGGISIDLYSLDENGNRTYLTWLKPTVNASQVCNNNTSTKGEVHELKFMDAGYLQEYDAYFELEAGDVDGDGFDELLAYTGAYRDVNGRHLAIVDMFKTTNGSSYGHYSVEVDAGEAAAYVSEEQLKHDNPDWVNAGYPNQWRMQILKTAPVVTIAAGDLDRNGTDEVAITVSAPTDHSKVASAANCYIFNWDGSALKSAKIGEDGKGVIPLAVNTDADVVTSDCEKGTAMVSANCTFGTFLSPNTNTYTTALVICGYQSAGSDTKGVPEYKRFAYRYVYYDIDDETMKVGAYHTRTLGTDGKSIVASARNRAWYSEPIRYFPTLAPIALGAARLEGIDSGMSLSDHLLIAGDVYAADLTTQVFTQPIGSMSLTTAHCNQNGHNKYKDHVWIGDVVTGIVSADGLAHESFLAVVGVRRDTDLRYGDDYYWFDVAHFSFSMGNRSAVVTGQEGVVCEGPRATSRTYGTYVSLCLPDLGDDNVIVRFVDKAYIPSAPEALAILQDAPMFAELNDTYSYVANGATSFGQFDEHGASNGFYIHAAVGGFAEGQLSFLASGRLHGSLQGEASYEWQCTVSKNYSVTYSTPAGKGNMVVVYSVPYVYYKYEVYDPESDKWVPYTLPVSAQPVTSVVSVEHWNKVVEGKTSMYPIDESVIRNVSGKPETYIDSFGGEKIYASKFGYAQTTTLTESEGPSVEQSITDTWSDSHTIDAGLSACIDFGIGPKFLGEHGLIGFVINGNAGYHHAELHDKGSVFTGTVDNLPKLDELANNAGPYSFSWMLMVKQLKKQKGEDGKPDKRFGDAWIVGYDVQDVYRPSLSPAGNPHVSKASSESITLSWDAARFGSDATDADSAYAIGMLSDDRKPGSLDDVATWRYVSAGATEYTWTDLAPSKSYSFVVRAVRGSWAGEIFNPSKASISSPEIMASTLADGEACSIDGVRITSPASGALTQGEAAVLETSASWTKKGSDGASTDKSDKVYYRWEMRLPGETSWTSIAQGYGNCDLVYEFPDKKTTDGLADAVANAGAAMAVADAAPVVRGSAPSDGETIGLKEIHLKGLTVLSTGGQDATSTSRLTVKGARLEHDCTHFRCSVGFDSQHLVASQVVLHVDGTTQAAVSPYGFVEQIQPSAHADALLFGVGHNASILEFLKERHNEGDNGNDNGGKNDAVDKTSGKPTAPSPGTTGKATAKTADYGGVVVLVLAVVVVASAQLTRIARRH